MLSVWPTASVGLVTLNETALLVVVVDPPEVEVVELEPPVTVTFKSPQLPNKLHTFTTAEPPDRPVMVMVVPLSKIDIVSGFELL